MPLQFHYGGSTWVMMFEKGVNVKGSPQPGPSINVPVNSQLGIVMPARGPTGMHEGRLCSCRLG